LAAPQLAQTIVPCGLLSLINQCDESVLSHFPAKY
jgi:hypothetical protein